MREIKAPAKYKKSEKEISIFLSGSIEMGKAPNWQAELIKRLADIEDLLILNPRRDDWDSSWKQSIENPKFREQVEWELDGLERADIIVFYFDPGTKASITLLELGLCIKRNIIVCCPKGFWRKGNVDIVCKKHGVKVLENVGDLIPELLKKIKEKR